MKQHEILYERCITLAQALNNKNKTLKSLPLANQVEALISLGKGLRKVDVTWLERAKNYKQVMVKIEADIFKAEVCSAVHESMPCWN